MAMAAQFYPLGDRAVVVRLGDGIDMKVHHDVVKLSNELNHRPFKGMVEAVPAYCTVTVYYEPVQLRGDWQQSAYQSVCTALRRIVDSLNASQPARNKIINIPVCYDDEFAPDLDDVAQHNGIHVDEVREIHCSTDYSVYMVGFVPGFPYLGGLSKRIAAPRKHSPRSRVEAGSVGIAGEQTGIYPLASPGGWQIIGRTPLKLFNPRASSPSLLQVGDTVRFYAITRKAFEEWEAVSP